MNVLHICSDFAKQRLYDELVSQLERAGVQSQFVYVPVRSEAEIDVNRNPALTTVRYRYSKVLRRYHRVLFRRKIAAVVADLTDAVDVTGFGLTHAHFLYSDGAVARVLRQRYGLPYVVAVRNTDLNFFMRYRPDLLSTARSILRDAHTVVFISPTYLEALLAKLPPPERAGIRSKSRIVPNGLTSEWFEPSPRDTRPYDPQPLRLLYVGDFTRNKNIPNLLRAVSRLRDRLDAELTLIGGGGDGAAQVERMLASDSCRFAHHRGRIDDRAGLIAAYRRHDVFVMPSITETFGVVYVEALSQGLPIVHSRGQGVDGYFDPDTVAAAVDPHNPADIAAGIEAVARRLPAIRSVCREQAARFDWTTVAGTYMQIYSGARRAPAAGQRTGC